MPRFDMSQYSTVAERIDLFWTKFGEGRLHTEMVHFSPEQVVIRAEVYLDRDDLRPVTVDYAEERLDSSPVNRVSMVENCATSAIGRALADLGGEFTGTKRPSREEMQKVERAEKAVKPTKPEPEREALENRVASVKNRAELGNLWEEIVADGHSQIGWIRDLFQDKGGSLK